MLDGLLQAANSIPDGKDSFRNRSQADEKQKSRSLAWYVQQVTSAFAVVSHLLSTEYQNWELHNAKHALVSGLALGMAKPLLMLAHEPYPSPLDYHDLLRWTCES